MTADHAHGMLVLAALFGWVFAVVGWIMYAATKSDVTFFRAQLTTECGARRTAEGRIDEFLRSEVRLWLCPVCGFTFDAAHTDEPDGEYYSCSECERLRLATAAERVLDLQGDEIDAALVREILAPALLELRFPTRYAT